MNKAFDFLRENSTFFIATVDGDRPRVRPFGAVCKFENKLYICTNNKKPVYSQILANPKVEISAISSDMKWIRIACETVVDDRISAKTAMLEANPNLRNMYDENDDKFAVLYLKNATATISSMTGEVEEVNF